MSYMKTIDKRCQDCAIEVDLMTPAQLATVEVFNSRHESLGLFCVDHGMRRRNQRESIERQLAALQAESRLTRDLDTAIHRAIE